MQRMLFLLFALFLPASVFAGVGKTDSRYYVTDEMWATHPYNKFVKLDTSLGMCSAQYVSKNLILSAAHCIGSKSIDTIENYKGQKIPVSLLYKANYTSLLKPGDWAVWKIDDPQYYSDDFFGISVPRSNVPVINAGWGWCRILTNEELKKIRSMYSNIYAKAQTDPKFKINPTYTASDEDKKYFALADYVKKELQKQVASSGMKPLYEADKLKASECHIIYDDSCSSQYDTGKPSICRNKWLYKLNAHPNILMSSCDVFTGNSGGGFVSPAGNVLYGIASAGNAEDFGAGNEDYNVLVSAVQFNTKLAQLIKQNPPIAVQNPPQNKPKETTPNNNNNNTKTNTGGNSGANANSATPKTPGNNNNNAKTNTGGNSGANANSAAPKTPNDNNNNAKTNTGNNSGANANPVTPKTPNNNNNNTETNKGNDSGANANPVTPTTPNDNNNNTNTGNNSNENSAENQENEIDRLKDDLDNLSKSLGKQIPNTNDMSDSELLNFTGRMVEFDVKSKQLEELQKAYDEARAKEQSIENRALTALTVAATGIGGMELARGLAEQSADEAAAADMSAYIATMHCDYADGKQVKYGPEEIELPGGNNQEMMNLRAQYLALAADLKERKTALGMKPGIESEEIGDKIQTGLYDDENVGITSGNYASLYRAMALGSEEDQAKIDDAAAASKRRVVGGAIAAGAGVAVGIAGNLLINGTKSETTAETNTEKSEDVKDNNFNRGPEKEEPQPECESKYRWKAEDKEDIDILWKTFYRYIECVKEDDGKTYDSLVDEIFKLPANAPTSATENKTQELRDKINAIIVLFKKSSDKATCVNGIGVNPDDYQLRAEETPLVEYRWKPEDKKDVDALWQTFSRHPVCVKGDDWETYNNLTDEIYKLQAKAPTSATEDKTQELRDKINAIIVLFKKSSDKATCANGIGINPDDYQLRAEEVRCQ